MPKRRWRFTIRTALVITAAVAALCTLLGYEGNVVRVRRAMIDRLMSQDDGSVAYGTRRSDAESEVPWFRRLLGDKPVAWVYLPLDTPLDERQRILSFLPEARLLGFRREDMHKREMDYVRFPEDTGPP